ncbi:RbtT/DalT/CsbX family MFS transporter [Acetobacter sp. TBRC 12305]|uniref:MFS transporter n=1 Tax=Acetobacter garciniae TaxID=2817435 RepID=A0A939HQ00_9PROT|nr:RbtT/DalT/CsbX family MFS transporter [Acetobacter garciniae]MBO1326661.1 MFS transporter [Acetobacter garciniae]MBX0345044.1 RbtT/DalT/CsbX family MFS transporter [Acetobacter garciniae]
MSGIMVVPHKTPRDFAFQYVGLLLFMIGDGVEVGYLSPFLVTCGLSEHAVALVFTLYGVAAAISAWAAGLLCDGLGCRKVVIGGIVLWTIPQVLFLSLAVPYHSAWGILLTYSIRGFGYPMLAYGILTLVVKEVRYEQRGLASGIFWFCFTCGLPTLGTVVASFAQPAFGDYRTFWLALVIVVAGGSLALVSLRDEQTVVLEKDRPERLGPATFLRVSRANPSLVLVCIVRAINSAATHGILVFMPFYFVHTLGLSNDFWICFLETIFASNIVFNVVFGAISDRLSWRGTILWAGGVGSSVICVMLYWVPALYGHSHPWSVYATAILFGLTLAGYVPLSALAPSLLPERKGLAMSFLNFGAGCSVWLGPLVVYAFEPLFGVGGVLYIYAFLFFFSGILVSLIKIPEQESAVFTRQDPAPHFSLVQS